MDWTNCLIACGADIGVVVCAPLTQMVRIGKLTSPKCQILVCFSRWQLFLSSHQL